MARRPGKKKASPPVEAPPLEVTGAGLFEILQPSDCQKTLGDRLLSQYQADCLGCGERLSMSVHVHETTRALNRYTIMCGCGQYVMLEHFVPRPKT